MNNEANITDAAEKIASTPNTNREWLLKMADLEDGGEVGVGGMSWAEIMALFAGVKITFSRNCSSGILPTGERCECWRCRRERGEPLDVEIEQLAETQSALRRIASILPLLLFAAILPAAPILSDGNETCLPAPCTVQVITPHSSWLEASWISHTDSGANATILTVANGTIVSFFERLTIATVPTSASIRFAADDSASLFVNGLLVIPAAPADGNGYSVCSDAGPTCWQWTEVNIAPWLAVGENELRFDVEQRGRYGFGLAFTGAIVDIGDPPEPPVETPEPGTLWMLVIFVLMIACVVILKHIVMESIREWELGAKRCTHYRLTLEHISTHSLCMETRAVARKALEDSK